MYSKLETKIPGGRGVRIICSYCKKPASLVTGEEIYPHRKDLYHKFFWLCKPCDAYTGCHRNTNKPLGRLAGPELRKLKVMAHSAFDPLWKNGKMKRKDAYKWLSDQLKINFSFCHIGYFDEQMCKKVIDVCKNI